MKALFVALILTSGVLANAQSEPNIVSCVTGDQTLNVCEVKAQPRDHEIALSQFQAFAFCAHKVKGPYVVGLGVDQQKFMYGMKPVTAPKVFPLKYKFSSDPVEFVMTIKSPKAYVNSTFSIVYTPDYSVSSSFECK